MNIKKLILSILISISSISPTRPLVQAPPVQAPPEEILIQRPYEIVEKFDKEVLEILKTLEILIAQDPDLINSYGWTVLYLAANNKTAATKLLLSNNANPATFLKNIFQETEWVKINSFAKTHLIDAIKTGILLIDAAKKNNFYKVLEILYNQPVYPFFVDCALKVADNQLIAQPLRSWILENLVDTF